MPLSRSPWVRILCVIALLAAWTVSRGARAGSAPGGGGGPVYRTFTREQMVTRIEVMVPDAPGAAAAADAVFAAFAHVEEVANEWREGSPLAEVNRRAGGAPVAVPRDLLDLLVRGLEAGRMTEGAFDVTWAALWGVWDFRPGHERLPGPDEVRERLPLIDYRAVEVDGKAGTVRLPRVGMKLGLGGIAKGYALERAGRVLAERGIRSYSLSAGGQILAGGRKGERPWRVGIRDPWGPRDDAFALVDVEGASVSTSGVYEHAFERDGVLYHHILDPRTGQPARGVASATVVSKDPTLADALSTAVMVQGPERGLALAERLPDVEAVVVDDRGGVRATRGLEGRVHLLHAPRAQGQK